MPAARPCLRLALKGVRLGVEPRLACQVGALGCDPLGVAAVLVVELGGRVSHRARQPVDVGMEEERGERIPHVRDYRPAWRKDGTGAPDGGGGRVGAVVADENASGSGFHAVSVWPIGRADIRGSPSPRSVGFTDGGTARR
jgi:hypothetical protein